MWVMLSAMHRDVRIISDRGSIKYQKVIGTVTWFEGGAQDLTKGVEVLKIREQV